MIVLPYPIWIARQLIKWRIVAVGFFLGYLIQQLIISCSRTFDRRVSIDRKIDEILTMKHFEEYRNQAISDDNKQYSGLPLVNEKVRKFANTTLLHSRTYVERDLLYSKVRIMCCVFTTEDNFQYRARHVKQTWGSHCNTLLFFSSPTNNTFQTVILNITDGRDSLYRKTVEALRYAYEHHFNDADYFLKADDDAFVIVENLRYMLSGQDPWYPAWYGRKFRWHVYKGYMSGGAGYVLSKGAVQKLYKEGPLDHYCSAKYLAEDMGMGMCMQSLGIEGYLSLDNRNRTRMHYFPLHEHIYGHLPAWATLTDQQGYRSGIGNISDHAISFHYIRGEEAFRYMYYMAYEIRVFGLETKSKRFKN